MSIKYQKHRSNCLAMRDECNSDSRCARRTDAHLMHHIASGVDTEDRDGAWCSIIQRPLMLVSIRIE
jgi:hypothetical protein